VITDATDAEIARREHAYEMGEDSPSDRDWSRYVDRVARGLKAAGFASVAGGWTVDGDETVDGFSLDSCYDGYLARMTVPAYIEITRRKRQLLAAEAAGKAGGVADLEQLATIRRWGDPIERAFTSRDTIRVDDRGPDYGEERYLYRHNGVTIDRARAVELIGERG
jgi:hypothetical protein